MNAALTDSLTIERFESGQVDSQYFDHEAHVYVGWLYVRNFELTDAIRRFTAALRCLTTALGVPGKYHATISWFFLLLIAERAVDDDTWLTFRARNLDLIHGSKATLARYYSERLLSSMRARQRFVLPDRLAS